jgi:2-oxoglutarate dehydrogenase E2 component (dihydrolipoamide succinyltransferase)
MATEIKAPAIGESITSGILASWLVKNGQTVTENQSLFSFETDKITTDVPSPVAGIISIAVEAGTEVAVGQVVASISEVVATILPQTAPESAKTDAAAQGRAGPAARKLAAGTGVEISSLSGSGKNGRVTKSDVAAAQKAPEQVIAQVPIPTPVEKAPEPAPVEITRSAAPTVQTFSPAIAQPQTTSTDAPNVSDETPRQTRKKMTPLRKRVAERLVRAKSEAAMLTTFNECDMSAVINLRKVHQEAFQKKHGVKLGFMSFFVKAVVQALKEVPQVNTQIDGDDIVENHFYDIGIAVGAPRGLVVPVVRDADKKSFADIENSILNYGKRAREGKLTIDELQGGVFTITNGGIYGSLMSTPILNTPQSGILGMHAIKDRAVVVDGAVVARPMMYLALSYDHRVIDGKEAVTFLVKVREAIEDPIRLLFEV